MDIKEYRFLLISLFAIFCIVLLAFFLTKEPVEEVSLPEEGLPSGQEVVIVENLKSGSVGEVMVQNGQSDKTEPLVSPTMPPVISSTVGTIIEVGEDGLVISGNGSNFADGVSRDITAIFTANTLTFTKERIRLQGEQGLNYLKAGIKVLIGGQENIRGKDEFKVKTVNVI